MGFKEDEDFARFLTMGAFAAAAVSDDLEAHGHRIIELERYAKANKIWSIKVKRLRLPDLLCIRCGRRFESKGKSKLEVKLSHSNTPGREWWEGGMRMDDVFAFVRVAVGDVIDLGRIVYVTRGALHAAERALVEGNRKAISAGSERDVSWPSWAPSYSGAVTGVSDSGDITVLSDTGRRATYKSGAKWPNAFVYLMPGETFDAGDMVASCVEPADIECAGATWDWKEALNADDPDDRFAAVKAARWLAEPPDAALLIQIASDEEGDWRIRLEALVSGAAQNPRLTASIRDMVLSKESRPEERMEGVFALSELADPAAAEALSDIAEEAFPPEVAAAAVWGIGLGAARDPALLLPFLADADDIVALHASAALPEVLPDPVRRQLLGWLQTGTLRHATVAAHLLARHGHLEQLLAADVSDPVVKSIVVLAVGDIEQEAVLRAVGTLDHETRRVLQTLWSREDDWLRSPETDGGLDVLHRQRVRL
ncbi:MAG: hypothetical protein JWR52_1492 [Marmoricola sp.]|nr:hypothetical protein [Marmoricola sp.]